MQAHLGGGRLESPVLEVVQVTQDPAGSDLPTSSALPLAEGPGQRGLGWEGRLALSPPVATLLVSYTRVPLLILLPGAPAVCRLLLS